MKYHPLSTVANDVRLEEILEHGYAMLRTAEDEKWERLAELQMNQQEMLESYFKNQEMPQQSRMQSLRQMIDLHQRLIEAVVARRERLAEDLKGISVGRRALQAYQQCDD